MEMGLSALRKNRPADSVAVKVGPADVRAYRTYHSSDNNSSLVELPGLRLLHDGDNENTRLFNPEILKPLDNFGLCPWQGSDWAALSERPKPRRWLVINLNAEELEDHARRRLLPELCDLIPMQSLALYPGESALFDDHQV